MKFSRVHLMEWLTGLMGLILLVGLISGVSSPGFFHVLVLMVAAAGTLLPVVVAASARTNVPMVYETLLWIVSGLVFLALAVRIFAQTSVGFESGYLALGGMFFLTFALWRSVAREY